ncbi:tyrosine-type recombinase/integrase [Clostridium sp. C105KSO13]|uniref:tyrosine-type recombinase/integrase n=1 Tax=Clostridium sp. C105KSO13 TaxID=1776045 RepID=UPI0007407332|nr:tyrosine-type recombinase/integrase [Clostridium sp. C105KSO13]CUX32491.1 Tyrosine recombinase XerD [Clostridium sp. C105KSO13]
MERPKLTELTDIILKGMEAAGFKEKTRKFYGVLFNRLKRIAKGRGEECYTEELGRAFMEDDSHIIPENTERYHHERTCAYIRCIKFIESYLKDGVVDWTPALPTAEFPIKSEQLIGSFKSYLEELRNRELKPNTVDGYRRFTYYFIEYLENQGYASLSDMANGNVITFIAVICTERYQATSLGSHMPGLRIFLAMHDETRKFLCELPGHLPKKRDILQIYSDEEYGQILAYLDKADALSFRNKAITIIALETGMRAADICNLRLSSIDWEHDSIHIVQQKTDRVYNIPLSETIGNALVDYLLNERPASESDFVFLRSNAPFSPLMSHAGIRKVLFNVVNDADIESKGRIYGSRITRHSAASRMLRNGVPLPVISEVLGHGNPNSVMIYITTDDAKLAECTLPLPKGGRHNG